jgi:hypothetical protein
VNIGIEPYFAKRVTQEVRARIELIMEASQNIHSFDTLEFVVLIQIRKIPNLDCYRGFTSVYGQTKSKAHPGGGGSGR